MASQYRRRSLMLNTIAKVAQGNPTIITDSSSRRLQKLNIYGQSEQDGTPSVENPIPIISKEVSEIKVTGANLIKYPFYSGTKVVKGVTFTVNDDQSITINGTNDGTGNSEFRININDRFKNGDAISSGLLSDKNDENISANMLYISNIGTNSKSENRIVNDDSRNYDIVLNVRSGATIDNVTIKVMRNYGPTLLPYEPYKEQVINLTSPITLRGIPVDNGGNVTIDGQQYIADVIKEKNGIIGVERNTISFSLLVKNMNNNSNNYPGWKPIEVVDKILPPQANDVNIVNILCNIVSRTVYGRRDQSLIYFAAEDLGKTQTELKEQHPDLSVDFVAISYEPTFEPLPEEVQTQYKALKSYYPNTVIQTGCWNEVTYSAKRGG